MRLLRLLRKMAKKSSRKVKNRSKSTNRNSGFFVASEVNVNPVNRTFLPDDTVARISTAHLLVVPNEEIVTADVNHLSLSRRFVSGDIDDWWEDISMPGYASKRNLLRKLQEDDLYDDTRIVTSPFTNWWSHVGSRNLPDHLPREHKISVSPTLPDVPATPEIQHFGKRIPQERFDNMWDEKTEDLSSNPRTIKNARGSVLQKPKPNLESCATENILEREQHHSDSGNLSEHSLLYTSKDFTNRIRKQKGSRSIRRRKENYQKKALLNNIKKIELPDQNGSYESKQGHGSESESVKTHKIQLSKLMSCENNSISYPNVTDTYNNSLPERAQKTGRFDDAFKDGTVSITNEDLHLSQNSNKILSDLSSVTDIKGRLLLSSPNTKDMKRARKQRNLLHVSWSGQIDPNNSNVQNRRNITSLLDMTNPSIRNEFESKEPPKNGLKYLQGFLDVSNEDKLSEVNYKQTGKKDECTFLSKMNFKPKRTQEQFLNIEDLNEIPSEKLLTQLSHSEHKVLTKMSSLSDGSDSELPLPRSTSFRFSSSPQSTRDTSVGNVPTVSKVKSKFLQNLLHDTSICDSLSAESTTGTGKKLILSRASRNAKRGLISDKLLALSDVNHSKSVPASSITQPGMKLVPSEKHDSKGNSHLTINTSHSSRDVVKSPENISNNKSQPQRLRSNMESVFRTHTSTSNKDKYQRETNNESVKDTKSPSARIRTKSSTSQCSFPQSKVIALDSKSESMKNNSNAIGTVISKSKFMSNKFNTLFLEESRPKEDERDILSTTIVENNLGIMSQKLSAVRSHLKRQHEKLTLLQYRKACKQIQTHSANYAKFKKLLAHREKMEDIFNVNDRHSSKNNHVLNIRSQKKDIAEKRSNKETERGASILQYVKSTKFPLRISWGNAVGHPKLTAAVSKNKTSVNRKLKTSDRDVIIIRDVNKAPRIKRPTWLHTRLYKSLSKTVVMKIKDKNVINPQKKSQEIISKLGSLIDKALRYRRKGCNPFVDEVIKHLYHSAIIKTPMNFICFCMRYLPETFIDIALRVKENDSGILGNVIDRDLNL
ncbi:Protein of unknown function [Gryllus bimaculatus]|nr:Protein of unknown function [Gryllus bimaculatus]